MVPSEESEEMPALLEAGSLGRQVNGGWIWRGLDVRVGAGERVGLVGPSGSGKTLLLRALAGLDPVDEGTVTFQGRPVESWDLPRYRAAVTYLPQRAALAEGTVEANLCLPFAFEAHAGKRFDRARALELLEVLGRAEPFLEKRAEDLSGGEEQIAALIRALLLEPRLLLLDEPAASMDESLARGSEALVDTWLQGDARRALIWTSHRAERVARVTDRTVML